MLTPSQKMNGLDAVYQLLQKIAAAAPPARVDVYGQPQKYVLYPYQENTLEKIRKAIADGFTRIMVSSPTGSGKTVMFVQIIKGYHQRGKRVLFLVHRKEILDQVSKLLASMEIEHGVIRSGVPHEDHHHVQIAMFQTITRRMKNPYIHESDVVVVDEAHHATAKTFLEVIEHYSKGLVIGFSATPARDSGKGLGDYFEILIQVITIKELTDQGYLAPVLAYGPVSPDLEGVKVVAGDYQKDQLEEAMCKPKIVGNVVGHYQRYGEDQQAVCFSSGVKHAYALCSQFSSSGITAAVIDGKTSKEDREDILARFKYGLIRILINCQVLTEGVDIPAIGCVILARPTKSLPMYLQMVGRGMRTAPGKEYCILLDHAGAVSEHGFPDEITTWELSSTTKSENKKQAARKKKNSEPIGCPVCGLLYTGQLRCPGCGNTPTLRQIGKDIEYDLDRVLGEIVRKPPPPKHDKADWYGQFIRYGRDHSFKEGWAANKFREKFNVWPNSYRNTPPATAVSPEVLGFIRHCQIKRAKSPARYR